MAMQTHNSHWQETWEKAHERLKHLFTESRMDINDVIGDERGVDSFADAKKVLSHVLIHHPSAEEKACAFLSVVEALMAWHELNEHGDDYARAGALAK